MWTKGWRENIWNGLPGQWDVVIIGGGITGAGILREAARAGLKALLVEAEDFSSGTSSRSSKMVHGGLRYLNNAQFKVAFESIRERERLLREGRGLVDNQGFVISNYQGDRLPAWIFGVGLTMYDAMALRWSHTRYTAEQVAGVFPQVNRNGLLGGFHFYDAQTDDARLVLRVIREAVRAGGTAINYVRAQGLMRDLSGQVRGVQLCDALSGRQVEAPAGVVINAAGPWADDLRVHVGAQPRLRQLRGSHLVFSALKLPLTSVMSFLHPRDGRPVFAFPWEGATLMGTTDVDHCAALETDVAISREEYDYLLEAIQHVFKPAQLSEADILSTFSGVRAVVNTGKANPSKEKREDVRWQEQGLLTIAGGKLTMFHLMAQRTLKAIRHALPQRGRLDRGRRGLDALESLNMDALQDPQLALRLGGRYGADAPALLEASQAGELEQISPTHTILAELRWAARAEGVAHLDDLLLRRTRLGILLPGGAVSELARLRSIVQPELGWSDENWESETQRYRNIWQRAYSPRPFESIVEVK